MGSGHPRALGTQLVFTAVSSRLSTEKTLTQPVSE